MEIKINKQNGDERILNFQKISTVRMGKTNVKYCPLPTKALGRGISATVFPGYHFGLMKPTAVKFIQRDQVRRLNKEDEQMKELLIWRQIDHNINIIRLYDSYYNPDDGIFLAMELADRTFKKQILEFNPSESNVIEWIYQIASAVNYLHENNVIHRDIKPDNILMVKKVENKLVAKLADFGVSKMLIGIDKTSTFSNASGTILWMAPEALENLDDKFKNTRKLDIYALGMTMYFGLSKGQHPFVKSENENVIKKVVPRMVKKNAKPCILKTENFAAKDLLEQMMDRIAEYRPEISEVISHCLFWDWKSEQQFLIRAAICLSRQCQEIDQIKKEIDAKYNSDYQTNNPNEIFNWIDIANEMNFDIKNLLFTNPTRKMPTTEYGNGKSVTKFMKLFRDKYVHYPDLSDEAADKFSENDGVFCEEKYVKLLTSMCPGLLVFLYRNLQRYANEQRLMPLSKLYFPWKIEKGFEVKSETGKGCKAKEDDLNKLQEKTHYVKEVNKTQCIDDRLLSRDGEGSSLENRFNDELDFEDDNDLLGDHLNSEVEYVDDDDSLEDRLNYCYSLQNRLNDEVEYEDDDDYSDDGLCYEIDCGI